MFFVSDNASAAAPEVMAALVRANEGHATPYGADALMDEVRARSRDVFRALEAAVYLVATGTSANVLSLALCCPPQATIFCHRIAHIAEDECTAPEFYTGGARVTPVDSVKGKMPPDGLTAAIVPLAAREIRFVQPGMVSLTNVTEPGTIYTAAKAATLKAVAEEHGLPCHIDGARFANVLVAAGGTAPELAWKAGIDVLSLAARRSA